jgi:Fur family peroxide stress response transcriptional regulator
MTAEKQARVEQMCRALQGSGHRMTPQRLGVLRALVGVNAHPSAEEVHAQVRLDAPMTSLATVYKTLETLRDLGEAREMALGDGRRRYDAVRPGFHPHAVCTRCGRIEDVDLAGLDVLPARAAQASGFRVRAQRVEFYGLCRSCQEPAP